MLKRRKSKDGGKERSMPREIEKIIDLAQDGRGLLDREIIRDKFV